MARKLAKVALSRLRELLQSNQAGPAQWRQRHPTDASGIRPMPPPSIATMLIIGVCMHLRGVTCPPACSVEKRSAPRLWPKSPNELYLSRGQDRHGTRRRLRALLRTEGRAVLHAMGAAIPRALELALEAVSESASLSESTSRGAGSTGAVQAGGEGGLQLSVNTSTLELVDDLRPLDPEVRLFCLCSSPNELTCVTALYRGGQGRQCGRCRRYTSPSSGARSDSASAVAHGANVTQ